MQHFTETTWFREFVKELESRGFTVCASAVSETQEYVVFQKLSLLGGIWEDRLEFDGTRRGLIAAMRNRYSFAGCIYTRGYIK